MDQKVAIWLILFCSGLGGAGAHASIINGDFETGNLTGWTLEHGNQPYVSVQSFNGNHKLVLEDGPGIQVTQVFKITTPQRFSIDYNGVFVSTAQSHVSYSIWLARTNSPFNIFQDFHEYYDEGTITIPLTTASVAIPPGTYLIGTAVDLVNASVQKGSGQLIIDNVRLTAVPEPATLTLTVCGLASVLLFAGSRSKRRSRWLR